MKLSLEWVLSHVDGGNTSDPKELANAITMATAEVEGMHRLERVTRHVVVCRIAAVKRIDERHTHVTVELGGGKQAQTVCGAGNVRSGLVSAFALPGATVNGGTQSGMVPVEAREVDGCRSDGILCSLRELNWGDFHLGIVEFPDNLTPGTPLGELVPAVDHILELDNKSLAHRADLWGSYGFSREVAAIMKGALRPLPVEDLAAHAHRTPLRVVVEPGCGCRGYCAMTFENLSAAPSPPLIQARLAAIGARPINLLVDLTNYVMYELGQPMHAFDGALVHEIRVAAAGAGTSFTTLDTNRRSLVPEDLLIWNESRPVALAGVMGGLDSEVTPGTTSLLLESANFEPVRVRRTAVRLGLRSESSLRFEKGPALHHMEPAIARYLRLLIDAGQKVKVTSACTKVVTVSMAPISLALPADYIPRRMGMQLPGNCATEILGRLGFEVQAGADGLLVTAPPHRTDIHIPEDIIEEVARIYGYDNIVPQMPQVDLSAHEVNDQRLREHRCRRLLSGAHQFVEVHSYSWYDDQWLSQLGFAPVTTLTLQNPSAPHLKTMRTHLLPNILAAVEQNRHHAEAFRLYEIGHVYHARGTDVDERPWIAGVVYQLSRVGTLLDLFLAAKGAAEDLLSVCAPRGSWIFTKLAQQAVEPWRIPGACLEVRVGSEIVGYVGHLAGDSLRPFGKGAQVAFFEFDLTHLNAKRFPVVRFTAPSAYPGSWMDFSILFPLAQPYAEFSAVVAGFNHALTRGWHYLYRYTGKGLSEGMASYTVRFFLGRDDRTVTGDELAGFHEAFVGYLTHAKLGLR